MRTRNQAGIITYHFSSLDLPGFVQAVFSRHGGVSPAPWDSLNLGGTVGDMPSRVHKNLDRVVRSTGFQKEKLVQVRQVHSARVIVADQPLDGEHDGDAILTNQPGLLLLMRFADCVPILLVDPEKRVVGIAHAGWQGTVKEVAYHAVKKMISTFGTVPGDIVAGIGPAIGPDNYEIGDDVAAQVTNTFKEQSKKVLIASGKRLCFNLWEANRISLSRAGVEQVEVSGICTMDRQRDWYSHRGSGGRTGRFGAVIGLKST